jgi:hypothetical protein
MNIILIGIALIGIVIIGDKVNRIGIEISKATSYINQIIRLS